MPTAKPKPARRSPVAPDNGPVSAPFIWAEPRQLFFFRTGRLIGAEGDQPCEIMALTEGGAVVRSQAAYGIAERCTLEVNSAHHLPGSIAWVDEDRIGLEFIDRRAVRDVLTRRQAAFPYRPPRLGLRVGVEVRFGSKRLKTNCHDISEEGIKVDLPGDRARGEEAIVALDELGSIPGRVQWWREGRAGIAFERPIPADLFTRWVTARLEQKAA
jgi:hypothetical protein